MAKLSPGRHKALVAGIVVGAVALSLGMSFAAVPLYRVFCQATGFAGTTQVASGDAATKGHRSMTVRFDANVAPGLPWSFEPESPSITLQTGTTATVLLPCDQQIQRHCGRQRRL